MNKKLAELTVDKSADYYDNKVVKALEDAGFVLVLDTETTTDRYYIVAENKGEWKHISPAGIYKCSRCGQNVMTSDIDCYKFCHGCGARMKGGE